jgi:hypothetical protein
MLDEDVKQETTEISVPAAIEEAKWFWFKK